MPVQVDPGREPFDLSPMELDAHEYQVDVEPGLPDLEHCFLGKDDEADFYEVNYINGYQLHNTKDDSGAENVFVTQMYRCHWANKQITWEPRSGLDKARDAPPRMPE